jgi:hypothetical protein
MGLTLPQFTLVSGMLLVFGKYAFDNVEFLCRISNNGRANNSVQGMDRKRTMCEILLGNLQ